MTEGEFVSIEMFDHHKPQLKSGDYTLQATTTVSSKPIVADQTPDYQFTYDSPGISRSFSVLGPRFKLSPLEIHAVFPPQGSQGDYRHALPHVVLNRSSLPWERSPTREPDTDNAKAKGHPSWLALLLIDEDEEKQYIRRIEDRPEIATRVRQLKLKELRLTKEVSFPHLPSESGDHEEDELTVIDIDNTFLQSIAPTKDELRLLAHVRKRLDNHDQPDKPSDASEYAVIAGNRSPKPGKRHTVYLVSMEGRYTGNTFDMTGASSTVRQVVLKSWQFTCADGKGETFKELLLNLNSSTLRLRLAKPADNHGEHYLSMGFVPLRQHQSNSQLTVSWYHGPLVCGAADPNAMPSAEASTPDHLIRHNPQLGMDDVAYAAAWELGRLLTLQDKTTSVALYHWKRYCHQQACHKQTCHEIAHLHRGVLGQAYDFPRAWFEGLAKLEGIPFNYLVPDERMLQSESIRFFQIDPGWIQCLLNGAFSIGSTTAREQECFVEHRQREMTNIHTPMSGFILRSELVSCWPRLKITGHGASSTALSVVGSVRKLSKNVLMCLFDGVVEAVDIYLPAEALHFGVDNPSPNLREYIQSFNTSSALAHDMLEDMVKVTFSIVSLN